MSFVLSFWVLAADGVKEPFKKTISFSEHLCRKLATCSFELLLLLFTSLFCYFVLSCRIRLPISLLWDSKAWSFKWLEEFFPSDFSLEMRCFLHFCTLNKGSLQGVCPKTHRIFPDLILKYLYLPVCRIIKTWTVRVIGNCHNCRVNCYLLISYKCIFLWVDSHCSWCLFCCRNPCSSVSGLAWPKESFNLICEFLLDACENRHSSKQSTYV